MNEYEAGAAFELGWVGVDPRGWHWGVGLWMVRRLIESVGGTALLELDHLSNTTTLVMEIPWAPAPSSTSS